MKVKIGDQLFDSQVEPIMLILNSEDKKHIAEMVPDNTCFCSFPETMPPDQAAKWMRRLPDFSNVLPYPYPCPE